MCYLFLTINRHKANNQYITKGSQMAVIPCSYYYNTNSTHLLLHGISNDLFFPVFSETRFIAHSLICTITMPALVALFKNQHFFKNRLTSFIFI